MKTFKLVGLKIELEDEAQTIEDIPLVDGLIINKEDGENNWLIEALVEKKINDFFQRLHEQNKEVRIQVTITKKSNFPAKIHAQILSLTVLKEQVSILLEGRLHTTRQKVQAEQLLEDLLSNGLSGNTLLQEFKTQLNLKKDTTK